MTKQNLQTKTVQGYGLVDYSIKLEQALNEGYRLDIDSNENCPTSFGTLFIAIVVKEGVDAKITNDTQVKQNDTAQGDVTQSNSDSEVESNVESDVENKPKRSRKPSV